MRISNRLDGVSSFSFSGLHVRLIAIVLFALISLGDSAAIAQLPQRPEAAALIPTNFSEAISPDDYLIRTGDRLTVTFLKTRLAPLELTVDAEGRIVHEQIGAVSVHQKSLTQVRSELLSKLSGVFSAPQIDIAVGKPYVTTVLVTGAVKSPGHYRVWNSDFWEAAIDSAGGRSELGSLRWAIIRTAHGSELVDLSIGAKRTVPPFLYAIREIQIPNRQRESVMLLSSSQARQEIECRPGETVGQLFAALGLDTMRADAYRRSSGQFLLSPISEPLLAGSAYQLVDKGNKPDAPIRCVGAVATPEKLNAGSVVRSLSSLIDQCGGLLQSANKNRITIYRSLPDDLFGFAGEQRMAITIAATDIAATQLVPGDSVVIPYLTGAITVSGAVRSPGSMPVSGSLAAQEVVSRAGGLAIAPAEADWRVRRSGSKQLEPVVGGTLVADGDELVISIKEKQP